MLASGSLVSGESWFFSWLAPRWLQGGSKVASWWLLGGSKVAPICVDSNAAALGAVVPRSYATDGQRSVDDRTGWPGDHVVLVNSQDVVGGAGV